MAIQISIISIIKPKEGSRTEKHPVQVPALPIRPTARGTAPPPAQCHLGDPWALASGGGAEAMLPWSCELGCIF